MYNLNIWNYFNRRDQRKKYNKQAITNFGQNCGKNLCLKINIFNWTKNKGIRK